MWLSLDLRFLALPGAIHAFVREENDGLTLIESGPASTLPALERALHALGFGLRDVRRVFVTHIHLDHAGAAGHLAEAGATILCHPRAERHLLDPSRLTSAAKELYGQEYDTLWGEMKPVPTHLLRVVQDREVITTPGGAIQAFDTPGHARHHHAWLAGDTLFTGDVTGARQPGGSWISVTGAPSQFDLSAYLQSLELLSGLHPIRLGLTHGGFFSDAEDHMQRYHRILTEEAAWFSSRPAITDPAPETFRAYSEWVLARAGEEADWHKRMNPPELNFAGIGEWRRSLAE